MKIIKTTAIIAAIREVGDIVCDMEHVSYGCFIRIYDDGSGSMCQYDWPRCRELFDFDDVNELYSALDAWKRSLGGKAE
jgi:hypothetical protein